MGVGIAGIVVVGRHPIEAGPKVNYLRLIGTVMKSRTVAAKRAMVARFAANALPLFASGDLKRVIDQAPPIARADGAHRRLERGGGFGKIILEVGSD